MKMSENYLTILEADKNVGKLSKTLELGEIVRNQLKILELVKNVRNYFKHSKNSTKGLEFQKITLRF